MQDAKNHDIIDISLWWTGY